mgnify:CR=1 FL=1
MEPDNPEKNKCYGYLQELTKQLENAKQQMLSGFGSVSDSKYVRDKWSVAYKELNVNSFICKKELNFNSYWKGNWVQDR